MWFKGVFFFFFNYSFEKNIEDALKILKIV